MPVFAVQRKTARLGKGVQLGVGLGFFQLVAFFQVLAFGLEVGSIQALRNFFLQRLAHLHHQLAQQPPLARRQAQGTRFVGRVKVVQVTQVRRHGPGSGHGLHQLLQQ